MSHIQAARDAARPRVDEIMRPYLDQINSTPELLSLLYDIGMLPEQTTSVMQATRLAAFCVVWKRMEDLKAMIPSISQADLVIDMPRELTDEQADAAMRATASFLDIKGSQLTVNREKMKARYRALVKFIEAQK